MEVITIESKTWKELVGKLNLIADYILSQENDEKGENELWVDNNDVSLYLHVSLRTLQRLRASGEISFSTIRGKHYYKVGEIKRMLEEKLIKSNKEYIKDLVANNRRYKYEKGRNTKKNQ